MNLILVQRIKTIFFKDPVFLGLTDIGNEYSTISNN